MTPDDSSRVEVVSIRWNERLPSVPGVVIALMRWQPASRHLSVNVA